jgi:hypothetical protein
MIYERHFVWYLHRMEYSQPLEKLQDQSSPDLTNQVYTNVDTIPRYAVDQFLLMTDFSNLHLRKDDSTKVSSVASGTYIL